MSFEVHTYAPELNELYIGNVDATVVLDSAIRRKFNNDYRHNVRIVRQAMRPDTGLRRYRLIATRADGTTETRFCAQPTVKDALAQLRKARAYYAETTVLNFKRIY